MKKNIFGIGVDIEDIDEFKKVSKKRGFLEKIFNEKELRYCFRKKDPFPHLAARYAGKEATIKALNSMENFQVGLWNLRDIEIYNNSAGQPQIKFRRPEFKKIHAKISLSHSSSVAIASVITF